MNKEYKLNKELLDLLIEHKNNDNVTFKLSNNDIRILLTYIEILQKENKKYKEVIDKATNELFILKDMIYKPETREENFEIQRKISSIIKRLNGKEVE